MDTDLLLLLGLVSSGDLTDEFVHGSRVVHLDLGTSSAEVLQLAEE